MNQKKECIIEFKGGKINLNKIKNRRLNSIFNRRVHDGRRFLFNYGDSHSDNHADYHKRDYKDHSDYSEYKDHVDYTDGHSDTWYEDSHTDRQSTSGTHCDVTDYGAGDRGRGSHTDFDDIHTDETSRKHTDTYNDYRQRYRK